MPEFAVHNHESSATKASPFFGNYGFHTRFTHSVPPADPFPQSLDTNTFTRTMNQFQDFLRTQIRNSQARYEVTTNQSRTPPPAFQVVDKGFLSTMNIRTNGTSRKLNWKRLGHFPIKKVISGYAYGLDLRHVIKLHLVFHVFLCGPAPTYPVPGQVIPPLPPFIMDDNLAYEIEEIRDLKMVQHYFKYYVKWTGHNYHT